MASIVPLVIASFPFVSRLVETSIREVDSGVVEAAQSMGATPLQIITKVLIPESMPSLIANATIAATTILGYGAMAGVIGGGGLGKVAINYGYYRYNLVLEIFATALLVVIETDSPGSRQCGYQIVATDADGRLLWDSGRVAGNACRGVPWRGAGLKAGDRVSFRIRVFDRTGNPSPFSVENAFAVALQSPADWNGARWVRFAGNRCAAAAPAPHFRREFTVGDGLRRAVLSITARGVFEPSLDGTRIGLWW